MTVVIGSTIGSYRILQQLGEGGMGAVYLAEHALLGRRAAIKVLLPSLSSRQEIVTRFFNEARAATAIADPGIVQIFDFGYDGGVAYLVMELLVGEALDARLDKQRLAPIDALRIARQIAGTLGSAHARGIIHRDLKPENVFLVRDPEVPGGERVKILDFGIAKLAGVDPGLVKTQIGAVMGTPLYMSPEQCRGAGDIDARSDIYALGCVLYHMLTGRPPFVGEGMGEVLVMQLHEEPRAPGYGDEIDGFVLRCLAKRPGGRFASMAEVVGEAERLLTIVGGSGGAWAAGEGERVSANWRAPSLGRTPTTLGGAAGARETAAATSSGAGGRRGAWMIAAAVVLVGAGVVGVLSLGGGDRREGLSSAGEPAGAATGEPAQAVPVLPAPVEAGGTAPEPVMVDAGVAPEPVVVDAAIVEPPVVDAAPAQEPIQPEPRHRPKPPRPPKEPRPPKPPPSDEPPRENLPPPCPLDENGMPTVRC